MSSSASRSFARLVAAAAVAVVVHAQTPAPELDITSLSPEELGELSISAAAKRAEPLFESPSAVSAVTSGEIGRFGFDTVADALRLVPGVQVSQDSAYRWGVGIRGFVGFSSTKLLVLMDGRTVYSPFYGGVDWAEANMQLQDLDRVEVVRGPGATLWGANAVNGVVNIISKDSRDTQGAYLSLREGTVDGADANLRYGGQAGDHTWYRVYLTATQTADATNEPEDNGNRYRFRQVRAGFRTDSEPAGRLHLTLQGEVTDLRHDEITTDPLTGARVRNGDSHQPENILGRLHWQGDGGNEFTLQLYADGSPDAATPGAYAVPGGVGSFGIVDRGYDLDLDFTDRLKLGPVNDIVWGGGFRYTLLDLLNSSSDVIAVQQPRFTQHLANFFAQDEITVVPAQLKLTLGSKLERDEYLGWQALPSARLTWTPSTSRTVWLAASRAIRSPSRSERDIRIKYALLPPTASTPPVLITLNGSSAFHQENLDAYEAGFRQRWGTGLSFDLTAYVNRYTNLRNVTPVQTLQLAPLLVHEDLYAANGASARGYGVEASANWRASAKWHLEATATEERLHPANEPFPQPFAPDFGLPHEMLSVRSWLDLSFDLQWSAAAYYVSALRTSEFGVPDVAAYTRVDSQVTWWVRTDVEINAGVQNALDHRHAEASPVAFFPTTEIPRNFFLQMQWRY